MKVRFSIRHPVDIVSLGPGPAKPLPYGDMMVRTWGQGSWNTGTWDQLLPAPKEKGAKMPKVKTGVSRMDEADVLLMVGNIISKATGKTELVPSPVTLAQLAALKGEGQDVLDAEALAIDDLVEVRTERADKFAEIRVAVDGFAQHAGTVYKHSKALLQAVGLDVANPPTSPGVLPAPVNLQSYTGDMEGTIFLQWELVPRRGWYEVECATILTGPWIRVYADKKSRTTCALLTPGTEYFFRVRAMGGTTVFSAWSDITRKRAA